MKTAETVKLEKEIREAVIKQGVFGCFEVTIGWFGKERVDFMTFDTKGIFRCYEIKVTKSDFYSPAAHTFCGNYNYFVLTAPLYEQVKQDIPSNIGVYINGACVKKAKKQDITIDSQILKYSLIRSLAREAEKVYKADDVDFMAKIKRENERLRRESMENRRRQSEINNKFYEALGRDKYREIVFSVESEEDELF